MGRFLPLQPAPTWQRHGSDKAFASLVKKAMVLAKSKAALGLPGYLGPDG
ncbi:hypothetical protein [Paraburkholderia sp. RL17-337-BIB-A]